eukprot:1489631-Rhodomonas_salina.1
MGRCSLPGARHEKSLLPSERYSSSPTCQRETQHVTKNARDEDQSARKREFGKQTDGTPTDSARRFGSGFRVKLGGVRRRERGTDLSEAIAALAKALDGIETQRHHLLAL